MSNQEHANVDTHLIRQYNAGQREQAFAALVERHSRWVWMIARRRVRDAHLADDVAQAVFILLARRLASMHDGRRLSAWLARVTHYTILHALRSESRQRARENALAQQRRGESVDPSLEAEKSELAQKMDGAIAGLRGSDRDLIVRRFYLQQSINQMAQEMSESPDTVRKRLERAIGRLAFALGARHADESRARLAVLCILPGGVSAPLMNSVELQQLAAKGGAASSALELAKGANHMIRLARLKMVSLCLVLMLMTGASICAIAGQMSSSNQSLSDASLTAVQTQSQAVAIEPPQREFRQVWSENVMVRLSGDKQTITGFSMLTGTWEAAASPSAAAEFKSVIVAKNVAAIVSTEHAIGFSAVTGKWDEIKFKASTQPGLVLAGNIAMFATPEQVAAFSAVTGKWAVIQCKSTKAPDVIVAANYGYFELDGKMYIFSVQTGKWAEPIP